MHVPHVYSREEQRSPQSRAMRSAPGSPPAGLMLSMPHACRDERSVKFRPRGTGSRMSQSWCEDQSPGWAEDRCRFVFHALDGR